MWKEDIIDSSRSGRRSGGIRRRRKFVMMKGSFVLMKCWRMLDNAALGVEG